MKLAFILKAQHRKLRFIGGNMSGTEPSCLYHAAGSYTLAHVVASDFF